MSRLLLAAFALLLIGAVPLQSYLTKNIDNWRRASSPARGELETSDYLERVVYNFDQGSSLSADQPIWFNQKVDSAPPDLAQRIMDTPTMVLGESTSSKWIEIDLSSQRLYAHEGDRIVYDFPISSGLPWMPTVTGEFYIWSKVRSQRMSGGSIADGTYYSLPNVPFVQYFHKGYGLHGAYWHNDFGKPKSHGCVNMRIADAQQLFSWTEPSLGPGEYARYKISPEETVRVIVHGKTPPA